MTKDIEKIANNEAFCVIPWVHLHVSTNGDVNACCLVSEPFGNINSNSIKEIWTGTEMNEFRTNLLNNIKDERCNCCYLKEASGGKSLRQDHNSNYLPYFLSITAIPSAPIYWDIRFSNVCNFRCRTCWHGSSSRWFDEAVKLGETVSSKPIIRAVENLEKFYIEIEDSIDSAEEIYFAGGEPLVMDEHYKILEILEERKAFNKYLRYNTNFSKVNYKGINVFNVWSKFDKVSVGASLDAWGERGEFLRKEQKWDEVLSNREQMKKICPHVGFRVAVTVSVFNVFHIPDFHKELVSVNFIRIEDFSIDNYLQTPKYYSIQILPLEVKLKIKEKFEKHIEWINAHVIENPEIYLVNDLLDQFRRCITYLFANDLSQYIPQFISRCNKLDEFRSEKTTEVFPELSFMFES